MIEEFSVGSSMYSSPACNGKRLPKNMIDAIYLKAHSTTASLKKRMLTAVSNEQKEDWTPTPGYMQSAMPPGVWFGYCGRLALSVIMPEQHICCRPCACPGSPCWQRLCSMDSYSLKESGKYSLYSLSWRIKKLGCYDKKLYQKRHWIENGWRGWKTGIA